MRILPRNPATLCAALAVSALVFPLAPVLAQARKPAARRQTTSALSRKIDAILSHDALVHGIAGVEIRSLSSGRILYARNPQTSLMPASNMKLVTAAASLGLLGASFRYKTELRQTGAISEGGALSGDLILKGTGDPSLDFARLTTLAKAAHDAGIRSVSGRIVADATVFSDAPLGDGWQWDDESYYYSAQVAGLGCDENVVAVSVKPGEKPGERARTECAAGYIEIVSTATTVAGKDSTISIERDRGTNLVRITGTIGATAPAVNEAVTIENPARFAAFRLAQALRGAGISVPEETELVVEPASKSAALVGSTVSAPLSQLLPLFLKPSDNYFGECLLRTIGREKSGRGTAVSGAAAVRTWLSGQGVDIEGVNQADGSGLSRMNWVTSHALCDLLVAVAKRWPESDRKVFVDALPVGGVDGTLRGRFSSGPLKNNVRAKTGTLTGASSLSGYVTGRSGERFVFSIVLNHYSRVGGSAAARAAQDAIVAALAR